MILVVLIQFKNKDVIMLLLIFFILMSVVLFLVVILGALMNEYYENYLLYSDSGIRVLVSADDYLGESSLQAFPDSSQETLVETSEQTSEETSEELVSTEDSSQAVGDRRESSSEYLEENSEVGDSGTQVETDSQLLVSINSHLNNIYGLFIVTLVLVGCGLILKYIWGLLNK